MITNRHCHQCTFQFDYAEQGVRNCQNFTHHPSRRCHHHRIKQCKYVSRKGKQCIEMTRGEYCQNHNGCLSAHAKANPRPIDKSGGHSVFPPTMEGMNKMLTDKIAELGDNYKDCPACEAQAQHPQEPPVTLKL